MQFRRTVLGVPTTTYLDLLIKLSGADNASGQWSLWWRRYDVLQSILTLVVACIGGIVWWILAPRRGAPYREQARRAGRLDLGGGEPES